MRFATSFVFLVVFWASLCPADNTDKKPAPNPPPPDHSSAVPSSPHRLNWVHLFRELQSVPIDSRSDYIFQIFAENGHAWSAAQKVNLLKNFLRNEDGSYSGAMWASPSEGREPEGDDPGEPDYRFHWIRDSAISVDVIAKMYRDPESRVAEKKRYLSILRGFATFSRKA